MPAHRSAMRKIKDVLRLKFEVSLSHRQIAAATGLSRVASVLRTDFFVG